MDKTLSLDEGGWREDVGWVRVSSKGEGKMDFNQ